MFLTTIREIHLACGSGSIVAKRLVLPQKEAVLLAAKRKSNCHSISFLSFHTLSFVISSTGQTGHIENEIVQHKIKRNSTIPTEIIRTRVGRANAQRDVLRNGEESNRISGYLILIDRDTQSSQKANDLDSNPRQCPITFRIVERIGPSERCSPTAFFLLPLLRRVPALSARMEIRSASRFFSFSRAIRCARARRIPGLMKE
ncbi:hypothetical protein ALC56_13320 [Trachymyrmex septentrionalis]|uniref:Uncharacterized protein n=1 Tax=Trachymyrmex septentrionalis TaxID=34720 RepID=A0A195EW49_9HYME|nr:hypothetical protein ALC56_13320 [Trachymyrmex septentrionalis]